MPPALDCILPKKASFKEPKPQVSPPGPRFGACLGPAPVACVVRIAGILITQLQPSARSPGDPGKHTLLRVMGRLLSQACQRPTMMFSFFQHPLLPSPAPNPGLIWEPLHPNKSQQRCAARPFSSKSFSCSAITEFLNAIHRFAKPLRAWNQNRFPGKLIKSRHPLPPTITKRRQEN